MLCKGGGRFRERSLTSPTEEAGPYTGLPQTCKEGAMSYIPRAIIEWPDGLSGQPTIQPVCDTKEQEEEIFRILVRALAAAGNGN